MRRVARILSAGATRASKLPTAALLLSTALASSSWAIGPLSGDPARGEQVYSRCIACHALGYDRTGPRHCGLFGRRAGSVDIFGVVGIEAVAFSRHDLARAGDEQAALRILQNGAFDLAALDELLRQELAVMAKALGERVLVVALVRNLADADRRALPRRLDEDGQPKRGFKLRKGGRGTLADGDRTRTLEIEDHFRAQPALRILQPHAERAIRGFTREIAQVAASVAIEVGRLRQAGAELIGYDPAVPAGSSAPELAGISVVDDPALVAKGADALVLLTEWPEFRTLDWPALAGLVGQPVVVDTRNLLDADVLRRAGFAFHSLGRR